MYNKYSIGILALLIVLGLSSAVEGQTLVDKLANVNQSVSVESHSEELLEKRISLHVDNQSLRHVLNKIQRTSGVHVFYTRDMLRGSSTVSLEVEREPLGRVLDQLLTPHGLGYWATGSYIILQNRQRSPVLETVEGTVTDGQSGDPLPGVNVVVKGTTTGTSSDSEGSYELAVPSLQDTLVFSFIGYQTQEVPISGRTNIDVELQLQAVTGEELVVTGYSSQSRRSITGSIESADVTELSKSPGTSVEHKLQGQISGVDIKTSGAPGSQAQVRIRGFGTIGSNDPLYIIDGVPTSSGLNELNPNDIESISVMKDASSASIYGARAANGVVVITTKKGERGQKAQITYSGYLSIDTEANKIDVLNAEQWGMMEWRGQNAAGLAPSHPTYGNGSSPEIPEYINGNPSNPYDPITNRIMRSADTDWFDAVTQNGFKQNHNLSISGGGESARYNVSFGSLQQEGTQIHTNYNRYTTRLNTEFFALDDRVRVGENISITYSEELGARGANWGRYRFHPLIPVYDEAGNFGGTMGGALGLQTNQESPVAAQVRSQDNKDRLFRSFGNVYAEADILPTLVVKTNVSIDYSQSNSTNFNPKSLEISRTSTNSLNESSGWSSSLTWSNTLNYAENFGDHSVGLLLGTEAIELKNQNSSVSAIDFFSEQRAFTFLSTAGEIQDANGSGSQRKLFSLFGKVDYAFKDKYLIDATLRRDGSSALASANRYQLFPAVGAAWVISDESFLENNDVVSLLKLRAGWGKAGNQNSLSDFAYVSTFAGNPFATGYDISATNSGLETGFALLSRGNENLIWEKSETLNLGLDVAFLDEKISGSVEWYDRNTNGLILRAPLPLAAGIADPPFINVGKINNKGVDVKLGYDGMVGPVALGVTGIVSTYRNKVISLDGNPETFINGPGGNPDITPSRTKSGYPIGMFYGLIVDGVIQDGENAGNFDFRDLNGDGEIDPNDDSAFIGNPHPDFTYSLNINANYKNFDLTAFFRGTQGNDVWQWVSVFSDFHFRSGINRSTRVLDAWRPDNPTNELAEYNLATSNYNLQGSSYYVEDGSYLRLQTLQLGYTFPDIFLENLRVYIQGQNLFTVTNYSGLDPELTDNGALEKGVDRGDTYPVPRSVLFGVDIRF